MNRADANVPTTASAAVVRPPQPARVWLGKVRARTLAGARLPLAALGLLVASASAQAQWSSIAETSAGDGAVHQNALVTNERGASLRIFLASDNRLIAKFQLNKGLLSLDPVTCPTLQIDTYLPEDFNLAEFQCEITGAQASITLTQVKEEQLESKTFLELMNGRRLMIRYRLQGAGYGQQAFSLKGSKQALKATLTHGIVVIGD